MFTIRRNCYLLIKNIKKAEFQNLVKKKIRNFSKEYLIILRNKHFKSENLLHENAIKDYLTSNKISTDENKLLFVLKKKTVDVKTNYSNGFSNKQCRLCKTEGEEECEIHLIRCVQIVSESNLKNYLENISYSDIFGTLDKQIAAAKVWNKGFKVWNRKLETVKLSPRGHQEHLPQGLSASFPCTSTRTVDSLSLDDSNCTVYEFG